MRIAALDWGLKRIGIAISDERKKIALPMETVPGGKNAIVEVMKVLAPKQVELILIGLPLLLSGKEGDMAIAVKQFALELEKASSIPVKLVDERFSSKLADQHLKVYLNRKERTAKMDITAAAILLQEYLDSHA